MADRPRVLCVDDDPRVLEGLQRILRRDFEVTAATGGPAALQQLEADKTFQVIVCDMRMPGVDGVGVLAAARHSAPDITRVLLTGQADIPAAAAAVNEGQVFRFLTKPCPPDLLLSTLAEAAEHHRHVTVERELLERTLRGSVQALVDVLALSNPAVFGRASRVRRLVGEVAALIGYRDRWQMEMAAMLSQVGVVSLSPALAARYAEGAELGAEERALVARLPEVALRLLGDIPRLDETRAILRHLNDDFDPEPGTQATPTSDIPIGALLLRPLLEYDLLVTGGCRPDEAMARLRSHARRYDPAVLTDIGRVTGADADIVILEIPFQRVQLGMSFMDDVKGPDGTLLVARGQEVTTPLLDRIENYWSTLELPLVRVRVVRAQ